MGAGKRTAALAVAVVFLYAAASIADAELTERGDLFVRFVGGIAPNDLPRQRLAPITVRVGGTVKTLSGKRPPALRKIKIALNRNGRLDYRGLPVCRLKQIEATSGRQALEICGESLVGGGRFVANTAFPEQAIFPSHGHIIAFNAVFRGRRAILAHVYGTDPVPITRIIVFHIRRVPGAFGTVLTGSLPISLNRYGYVKSMSLRLYRRYVFRGHPRSYISAACAAPAGFPSAVFTFSRASMTFADGRTLASTLTRSCRVRQ